MKRAFLVLFSVLIVLTGCALESSPSSDSSGESLSESSQISFPAENPPANSGLPTQEQSDPPEPSQSDVSSSAPESSSQVSSQAASQSPQAASSSQPAASSQVASSSTAPVQSSSTEPAATSSPESSEAPPAAQPSSVAPSSQPPAAQTATLPAVSGEVRAVWFSYLEFLTMAQNKSEAQFTANIATAFDKTAAAGFNSVWVQVRPFGDAMYPSSIFPYSYVLTGTEGQSPGYDPLSIMVREAKARGLSIEAWVNPYRIRSGPSDKALSNNNPAVRYLNEGSDAVIRYGNGVISYNPASKTARDLIVAGVVEIINNYDIDGIHFDDYFYPTTDLSFDSAYYNSYKASGGTLSHENWRRGNVNLLISEIYSAIKRTDSRVLFGVSPQANFSNNYNAQFADVAHWLSNTGYVDYICPQVYFGFDNSTLPFAQTVRDWAALITNGHTKLSVGIAAYKIGAEDKYAGAGAREWITGQNLLARMVSESRAQGNYIGFAMYRYDFLFSPEQGVRTQMEGEMNALKQLMKD